MSTLTHQLLQAALESDSELLDISTLPEVSEAVADAEEHTSAVELEQGIDALTTLTDAEAQLSTLKDQVDAEPELSVESYRYMQTALEAIVRPLGVTVPTLVSTTAQESALGERLTVSTEGLGSFIKSVLAAIVRAIKSLWSFFFTHLGKSARRAHVKLERLQRYRKAFDKAIGAVPSVTHITKPVGFDLLSYRHQPLLSQPDFSRASKQHYEILKALNGVYLNTLSDAFAAIERAFKGDLQKPYDEERGKALLDACNKACLPLRGDKLVKMFPTMQVIARDGLVGRAYLLGNRELEVEQPELAASLAAPDMRYRLANAIQSLNVRISADALDFKDNTIPALDSRSISKILSDMEVILTELLTTDVERKTQRLEKLSRDLEHLGEKAGRQLEASEATDRQYAPYASTIRYYHSISKWGVTPIAQMRTITLRVVDAVLNLAEATAKNLHVTVSTD